MVQMLQDVALFTINRQMAGHYVHGAHSLFYDDYYADIYLTNATNVRNAELDRHNWSGWRCTVGPLLQSCQQVRHST